jgi:hypothetical protein
MTNYRACLKDNLTATLPSRQELKLRTTRSRGDPKKIVDTFS